MRVKDIKSGGAYLINRRWAIRAGGPTPVTNPDVASRQVCDDVFGKADMMAVGALIRYDLLGKVGIGYSCTMWLKETDEVLQGDGLSRAGRTDDAKHLALLDGKRHAVQDGNPVELLDDVAKLD